ncbi:MAG TPA: PAS domain S-box protein [Solirubrobacter sp.]|nr:PAS domain S-box protein [Solirubrobacter sp.]
MLASAESEAEAFPALLAAIGTELGCNGALWLPGDDGELHCAQAWPLDAAAAAELVAGVWERERPDAHSGPPAAFAFPLPGIGVMGFSTAAPLEPDANLLATMDSLGSQISQFVERCRAQAKLRESDARKSAILNAAFDCIITMDHHGNVVEVNRATERTFGYRAEEMIGRELAELIIPPGWREAHREGVERYVRTGHGALGGHPLDVQGMRADGTEFPLELIVTRADLPGPPLFCGYLRDVTEARRDERDLRRLATEQAALRRVATAVATSTDPRHTFAVVTEEVGRLLGAQSSNMVRFDDDVHATVVGAWREGDVRNVPVGETVLMDGDTAASRVFRTGAPARVDSYEGISGDLATRLSSMGFKSAVAAPIFLSGRMWGAVIVSSVSDEPFPEGAEQRIADFAELAAQALANAQARADLAASRARIVQAGDAERRRLERNLHDGAQQRLVSLALMLRLAARRYPDDDDLTRASEELSHALQELRELARGIHPAVLTERGLEPAVRALADRAPLPVCLDVCITERLPDPVEAAAYYVVAEALTNVAKYAQASEVTVELARENGAACIEVRDDGVGGAAPGGGSGLRGLADRVEALGGRLVIESPVGGGTTLRAEIPCS